LKKSLKNDEKGVFLSEMDEDDYNKYIYETEKGWGKFYKKVFNLNK